VSEAVKFTRLSLYKGMSWTVVTYGAAQFVRLVAIIILTRLLTPELFGIMAIVNSVRTGIDLISDVGFGQSLVQNKNAERPEFYTTAWTLKLLRGLALWLVCAAIAVPVAHFYDSPILAWVLPVAALYFVFEGFSSISLSLMQRRLRIRDLSVLSLVYECIQDSALVVLSYFYRSIWPLVIGLVIGSAAKMVISFYILPDVRLKFLISKKYAHQILHFGRWIFFSSIIFFLSMNFDRLYLAKAAPLAMLGVYGVARGISDMMASLVSRMCGLIVFPYVSSSAHITPAELHKKLGPTRLKLLLLSALGLSAFAAIADLPVKIIYDVRYHAAAGMLPFTTLGVWFSTICVINESILLGFGKPQYAAIGNGLKFAWLLVGLPLGYTWHGFYGVILVVAASDLFRYLPVLFGQLRTRFSFAAQDLLTTFFMFGCFALFVWLRWVTGFGVAFQNPVE
jgi:O-antigen/teichoic acid export membrane protein